ncbi:MAG: DUF4242 domain-containing protein [Chloroflexi bacterium]|nr:DUF4242 domain-containing protein [Chloroflexota bacterium]
MAKFLALHTVDPRMFVTDPNFTFVKKALASMTPDVYCIRSLMAKGAGKIACEWEASSEQALIDVFAKVPELPVDGIYPVEVMEWAEVKGQLGI